jgi:hypothetical protein
MIDWLKKAVKCDTWISERREWRSRCNRFKVQSSDVRYGRVYDKAGNYLGYPIVFRAMITTDLGWKTLTTHSKKSAAMKSVEHYAKFGVAMPKKKKKRSRCLVNSPGGVG